MLVTGFCALAALGAAGAAAEGWGKGTTTPAVRPTTDTPPKPARPATETKTGEVSTGTAGNQVTDGGNPTESDQLSSSGTGGSGNGSGKTAEGGSTGSGGHLAVGQPEDPNAKVAYLTFDDGPDGVNTPIVLRILQSEHVQGTFFVIGEQVARYPNLLREEYQQGNSIGNHTYTHDYRFIYASPQNFWEDFEKDEELIQSVIGIRPQIYRCPGGSYPEFTEPFRAFMNKKGYVFFDWNVSAGDAEGRPATPPEIIRNVETQVMHYNHKGARVIILMHDGSGHINTARALPTIIEFLKREGFEFGTLNPTVKPIQFRVPRAARSGSVPSTQTRPDGPRASRGTRASTSTQASRETRSSDQTPVGEASSAPAESSASHAPLDVAPPSTTREPGDKG